MHSDHKIITNNITVLRSLITFQRLVEFTNFNFYQIEFAHIPLENIAESYWSQIIKINLCSLCMRASWVGILCIGWLKSHHDEI